MNIHERKGWLTALYVSNQIIIELSEFTYKINLIFGMFMESLAKWFHVNLKYSWFHEQTKKWIYCLYLHFILSVLYQLSPIFVGFLDILNYIRHNEGSRIAKRPNFRAKHRVPTSSGNHGKPGKSLKKFHAWKNHGIWKTWIIMEKSWNFVK